MNCDEIRTVLSFLPIVRSDQPLSLRCEGQWLKTVEAKALYEDTEYRDKVIDYISPGKEAIIVFLKEV